MRKLIILITGVGGDVGQSIIKCLGDIRQSYDMDILGSDIDPYAAGKKKCKNFFKAPKASEENDYFDFIRKLIGKEKINYIIPATEPEIKFYDRYREYLKNEKVKILINETGIINTFLDKYETVNFFMKNNLPYPKTYLVGDYKNDLCFPVILKERRGSGGKGLIVIKDIEELNFFMKRLTDVIIQEMIGNADEEYTAGVFSDGEKVYSISFKRLLGYGNLTKFAQLAGNSEITNIVEKIAKASNLKGSLNVQLRKTSSGYIPFEINPRFSSTVYIRHYFGFKDVKWWIDYYEGVPIKYELKYKKGIAVKTIDDIFFDIT